MRDDLGEAFEGVGIHTCTHRNEGEKHEKKEKMKKVPSTQLLWNSIHHCHSLKDFQEICLCLYISCHTSYYNSVYALALKVFSFIQVTFILCVLTSTYGPIVKCSSAPEI